MKAQESSVLKVIKNTTQFIIPIFQRNYSWTKEQCHQLWKDIMDAGKEEARFHFIGSIAYVQDGLYTASEGGAPLMLIDGQQRIATIELLLAALAERIGNKTIAEEITREKIFGYYLLNTLETGDKRYKLLLSDTDKATFIHILGAPKPDKESVYIKENYLFFQEQLRKLSSPEIIWRGLNKLLVVDVALDKSHDNPQLIFESMNSTGLGLSKGDLIRNYLLMDLSLEQQNTIYNNHWRPIEKIFGQEAYKDNFDEFIRHYLAIQTGAIPLKDKLYEAFKKFTDDQLSKNKTIDNILADMHLYADYYCGMFLLLEKDTELKNAFKDIKTLRVNVAYPLLLKWYFDYKHNLWNKLDFLEALRLLESYVFRRWVCGMATNSLDKTFLMLSQKDYKKETYLESIKAYFALLKSYTEFPKDDDFKRQLQRCNLYNQRVKQYWPWRMENFNRKEIINESEYTVEHIMPQNANLSVKWREDLGADWKRIHNQWCHTLGNLTLTGYNSVYSDNPFLTKRDGEKGYAHSPLFLNEGLGDVEIWNEEAIKTRSEKLANKALEIWKYPYVSGEILKKYKPKVSGVYTYDDHKFLKKPEIKKLFEAFKQETLNLDTNITEEIFKPYIAFKIGTNFVDVVPQASGLKLTLNMAFSQINDPRNLCKDLTNKSKLGNGDVQVNLKELDDLQYIMSLVKQAYETKMG